MKRRKFVNEEDRNSVTLNIPTGQKIEKTDEKCSEAEQRKTKKRKFVN